MRHFAIYDQPWPARLPSQAAIALARDEVEASASRRPPQKSVPAVERKRASSVDERPMKKRKTDEGPRVDMSAKAKELLIVPKRKRGRPRKYPLPEEELPKRKRGRPRKYPLPDAGDPPSSPPIKPPVTPPVRIIKPSTPLPRSVKKSDHSPSSSRSCKPKAVAVQSQPRDSNGRFGKKATTNGRFVRKKFGVFRALTRTERLFYRHNKVKQWLAGKHEGNETEGEEAHTADSDQSNDPEPLPTGKRAASFPIEGCAPPTKKSRHLVSPFDGSGEALEYSISAPSAISAYRFKGVGSGLLYHPNPTNYARRKWAPSYPDDVSQDGENSGTSLPTLESSVGPVTPDDQASFPIAGPSQLEHKVAEKLAPRASWRDPGHIPNSVLTFRPSPVNFARRRWSSLSKSALDSGPGTRRSVRLHSATKGFDADGTYATHTGGSQSNTRVSSVSESMYIEGGAIPHAESYASPFDDVRTPISHT